MGKLAILAVSSLLVVSAAAVAVAQTKTPSADEPFWAWGWSDATQKAPPAAPKDNNATHTAPGSALTVKLGDINLFNPPDWFPSEHPVEPAIVAHGDMTRMINACTYCHLPSGTGRAENANLTGLNPEYFAEQINEFKNGQRVTSDPRKTNTITMSNFAKAMTPDEVAAAAAYFGALKTPATWLKVSEAATVPKTVGNGSWSVVVTGDGAGTEPIGNRIIETPNVPADQDLWRDPHSGFTVYVPVGSIAKGKALVETGGGGRFTSCATCHGQSLDGLGPVPPLAGRSPSYIARQLYDMADGNRSGTWTQLMVPVVSALTPDDIVNISAYLGSLKG